MTDHKSEHSESGECKDLGTGLSFGKMLRNAREEAGYTVERVAMATRISPPFIEALENEQFSKLPGDMFGRGFLRNLCKAYGTPAEPLLIALERSLQSSRDGIEATHLAGRDEKRHQQLKKGVLSVQPKEWKKQLKAWAPHHYLQAKPLIVIGALLLLGIVLIKMWPSSSDGDNQESSTLAVVTNGLPPASETTPAPAATPTAAVAPAPAPPAAVEPNATAASVDPLAKGKMEIELRVKEPVSVTINKDQDKQTVEKLQVQTYRFPFDQQLKLYVENPAAVEIYFKGQRIGASAPKGEPKRFTFAASPSEIAKKEDAPKL